MLVRVLTPVDAIILRLQTMTFTMRSLPTHQVTRVARLRVNRDEKPTGPPARRQRCRELTSHAACGGVGMPCKHAAFFRLVSLVCSGLAGKNLMQGFVEKDTNVHGTVLAPE
jgi:hypothetical protein